MKNHPSLPKDSNPFIVLSWQPFSVG